MPNGGAAQAEPVQEPAFINKIAVRTPTFWPDEPELWFSQLEGQFLLSGITQDTTKYAHVVSQLETKYAREVKDIIINPPEADKYAKIKNALIQRVSASQEQKTKQLLEHEELGDRKPSQFLRHLRTLAGTAVPEQLLRSLWLGRLPTQIQVILAARAQDPLEDIAEQADRIQEVTNRKIEEITTTSIDQTLRDQVRELSLQVSELSKQWRQPFERSRSRSRERFKQQNICYYHRRFQEKARKCIQPCSYQKPKETGTH